MTNASAPAKRAAAVAPGTLLEAILAVQGEVGTLFKDKIAQVQSQKGNYTYRYIGLDTIVETVGPILNRHGLVWQTFPSQLDGKPSLDYVLSHAATGTEQHGKMLLPVTAAGPQAFGAALTYARRYALCSVLNLVADEDDDAKAAQQTMQSGAQLARARANMDDEAKALLAEADAFYTERFTEADLSKVDYARYKDSTGYTADGLQKLVDWLRANAPAETTA